MAGISNTHLVRLQLRSTLMLLSMIPSSPGSSSWEAMSNMSPKLQAIRVRYSLQSCGMETIDRRWGGNEYYCKDLERDLFAREDRPE